MFSRYTAMTESTVLDSVDHLPYPDPLSINYTDTQLLRMPKKRTLSQPDLQRFWIYMVKQYEKAEADDVLLTLNNVPYRGMLSPGDDIYLVDISDLYNFDTQKKPY